MCEPATLVTGLKILSTALVGATAATAARAVLPKGSKQAPPPASAKPPQAERAPDEQARRAGQAAPRGAPSGTMLTGAEGVSSSLLNLGRNTLLGQ